MEQRASVDGAKKRTTGWKTRTTANTNILQSYVMYIYNGYNGTTLGTYDQYIYRTAGPESAVFCYFSFVLRPRFYYRNCTPRVAAGKAKQYLDLEWHQKH